MKFGNSRKCLSMIVGQGHEFDKFWILSQSLCEKYYSGLYFPTFGLNLEGYSASLRIQSECGKIRTRITQHTDTFYAVNQIIFSPDIE